MMNKKDGLRTGIAEMRSVAQRLNQWADDLEASFRNSEADASEVPASGSGSAEKEKEVSKQTGTESAAAPKKGKALTLPEVRAFLAEKVAAGFGTQVKALIESYGAASLKGVPAEKYEELMEAVKDLGDVHAG